jgi:hypothetical protein
VCVCVGDQLFSTDTGLFVCVALDSDVAEEAQRMLQPNCNDVVKAKDLVKVRETAV